MGLVLAEDKDLRSIVNSWLKRGWAMMVISSERRPTGKPG
jgi:hypothetical protein